jgi:hypothetical protein
MFDLAEYGLGLCIVGVSSTVGLKSNNPITPELVASFASRLLVCSLYEERLRVDITMVFESPSQVKSLRLRLSV